MAKVGVLGVGMMGKGMVKNLLKAGHEVYAFDPFPEAAKKAKELGATVLGDPKEVAEKVEYLLASLPTSQAVDDAVTAALAGAKQGLVICDMSTAAVSVEKKLYAMAKAKGAGYLDCPVSGGEIGAENATMSIMVGGDVEIFEKAKPIFEKIGGNIFYLGPIGSGQVLKMCNNIVVANTTLALAEAFTTAVKAGVSAKTVFDIFKVSTANSRALDLYGKLMVEGTTEQTSFACKHMCKDVNLFVDLANDLKNPLLLSALTHQIYNAAVTKGFGNFDNAAVCKVIEELTGQKIAQ